MKNTDQNWNLNHAGRVCCPQRAVLRRDRDIAPYHRGTWLTMVAAGLMLGLMPARAVDFHVTTAQELQNALTLASANGADDVIYLAAGYYTGNFNYNSAEAGSLTLQGETGTTNTQITIDGAGTGRSMNLSSSGNAAITVRGITFLRNCGSTSHAGLRITTGSAADVLVEDCRFISPSGTSGMGLELASGQNATVRRCTAAGVSSGGGISISSFAGNVTVGNCTVTANSNSGLLVGSGYLVTVTNSTFGSNSGSGAVCSGTTVTFSGNTFSGNWSGNEGGGLSCGGVTTLTLSDNTFNSNSSGAGWGGGGAMAHSVGTVFVFRNSFAGNSGYMGCGFTAVNVPTVTVCSNVFTGNPSGGMASFGCTTVTLWQNTFSSNSSLGANCSATTSLTLSNNTFTLNSGGGAVCSAPLIALSGNAFTGNSVASGSGGGVKCTGGTITLSRNKVQENTAMQSGGGLYADGSTVKFLDNLVVKNQQTGSSYKGAGVWVRATSTLDMINNTVFGNTAAGSGGGVAFQVDGVSEILHVYNNIIWGNTAAGNGADVHLAGTGSRKEFLFNDAHGMYGVWDIAQNLLDVDPQFFDPVNGDYHLRSTSLCINAGTNGAPSIPATDLDGQPRIADSTVDLGCYEFSNTSFHPADVNGDWVISEAEYTAYAAAWKNSQPWATGPSPIPADWVTRAGFLKQNGGVYHNDGSAQPVCWKPGAP